jgi:hypothetical protein
MKALDKTKILNVIFLTKLLNNYSLTSFGEISQYVKRNLLSQIISPHLKQSKRFVGP